MTKSTLTTLSQSEKDVTELLLFGARELIAQAVVAELQALLEQHWIEERRNWCQRDLSRSRYVYWWDDGIYSNVRMDGRLCLLVIIGITEHGRKELVAVADGYRESEASWAELLSGLRSRGLTTCPKLAIGDGSLGFRKALGKCYPETRHKTENILSALPKSVNRCNRRLRPRCMKSGWPRRETKPTRHSTGPWPGSGRSIRGHGEAA